MAVFDHVSRQLRVLKPRVTVRVLPLYEGTGCEADDGVDLFLYLARAEGVEETCFFCLGMGSADLSNHSSTYFLYNFWLSLFGASIRSPPSHHYIFIHRQTLGLSTQKRVSDCPTGHESAHRIRPSSAPPPRWLESERSTWVNNNFLLVLWEIYKHRCLDTWSLCCRPLSFLYSSSL